MRLSDALPQPVGRGTFLSQETAAQLLGTEPTLAAQAASLLAASQQALLTLLGQRPDVPPAAPQPWTVLTEGEHAGWGLLALSDPPALSGGEVAQVVTHLVAVRQTLSAPQRRQLARRGAEMAVSCWAEVLAAAAVVPATVSLLSYWGVLSVCVGLNAQHKPRAADLLQADLLAYPAELTQPEALAMASLWAALWPLHGGLPRPAPVEVLHLLHSLRAGQPTRAALPDTPELSGDLAAFLPFLAAEDAAQLAAQMRGEVGTLPADPTAGICIRLQAGEVAYWLRRPREVHLLSYATGEVRQWVWTT